ncbi:MAG: peptidase S9 [Gemmatales bacterium]|nr:MAG: peptidase S9 [Gemmatales bacterium]
MMRLFFAGLLVLSLPLFLRAQNISSSPWTIDDVLLSAEAGDFQFSPDGKELLWVQRQMDKDEGEFVSHLWRASWAESDARQLTRGAHVDDWPRWSPDARFIAFRSSRPVPKSEQSDQIWLMPASGGEPWPLTRLKRSIRAFSWRDKDRIVFLAQEAPSLHENTLKEAKDNSIVVEDEENEPPVRLMQVEISSGRITRLTTNRDWITSFALAPNGRYAVTIHNVSLRHVYDHQNKPHVYLYDLTKGTRTRILRDPKFNVDSVQWPDDKGFYFSSRFTTHPRYVWATITELYYFALDRMQEQKVDLDWPKGLSEQFADDYRPGYAATRDGFIALLANGATNKLARYTRDGQTWKRHWFEGQHADHVFGLATDKIGNKLVYAHATASEPVAWYASQGADLSSSKPFVRLNDHVRSKVRARTEVIRWKGALDQQVEGILYYPHHYDPARKYPLVVMIHGGPFGCDFDAWEEHWAAPANLIAQKGAFVFKPNYHGSSNYGLEFAESIANGKYYDLPVKDIEAGVDWLIQRGLVDRSRVATMGWSNGAILSAALISHSNRFKAASLGAGGAEWVSDWGACEFGLAFDHYYFGKSPLEDPQLYIKIAPLYHFDKVTAHTIIFQGQEDRVVPRHHAWSQFRTLQTHAKADVRLVLFPGEGHGLRKLVYQRRKLREELGWFDRYLFGHHSQEQIIAKAGTPLDRLLELTFAKRQGNRFGEESKGLLVPETVSFEGIQVGRFEVTAAQFAEFDKNYRVLPGRENFPATGISAEQASKYCTWLSQKTGRRYRLPNEAEAKLLYDGDGAEGENILDYWAGTAVNIDDARRIREWLKKKAPGQTLVQEVGSFRPRRQAGETKGLGVFDLGGNVAEWVELKPGQFALKGGWASRPANDRQPIARPETDYIGFRVILEQGK